MNYDKSFIKEEVRSDWLVSEKTKKIWWVQLDLMKQLDKICKDNNLRWYPIFGTLLGAVRHKGFIPWDDDVDLAMPREDYDKLIDLAKKGRINYPYFLQTTLLDDDCFYMRMALCNSTTTGNSKCCLSKRQNNGIRIDILPLDGCERSPFLYRLSRFPVRVVAVLANNYVNEFNTRKSAIILRAVIRRFKLDYKKMYIWAENYNRRFKWDDYDLITYRAHADPMTKKIRRDMWHKSDFERTIPMPFEGFNIPVPIGYDRILRQMYDDYMKYPPLDKRDKKHDIVYEPDIPYKEYCTNILK